MPKRPMKPCAYKGCSNLVPPNERYCKEHKNIADKEYNKTKRDTKTHKEVYNTRRWRKVRELALKRDGGLCQMCLAEGRIVKADVVDHIVEIKDGGAAYDLDNLQSLCHSCHNKKTAQERKYRGRV